MLNHLFFTINILFFVHVVGCGHKGTDSKDTRAASSRKPTGEAVVKGVQSTKPAKRETKEAAIRKPAIDKVVVADDRETFTRSFKDHYYQLDTDLTDLFSSAATSELCWPATMASEMSYLRSKEKSLQSPLPTTDMAEPASRHSVEIRYFAKLCGTDPDSGTTVVQSTTCIANYLAAGDLKSEITVSGVDAQWDVFGLFPEGTNAIRGVVDPKIIVSALTAGDSVVMMIGYFSKTEEGWHRSRGHYVAVTGYSRTSAWKNHRLELEIMNPANKRSVRTPYEPVSMTRMEADDSLPKDIGYEVKGPGFSGESSRAFIETIITFSAAAN